VDELCYGRIDAPEQLAPGAIFLDIGWALLSEADGDETASFARAHQRTRLSVENPRIRAVSVTGADHRDYALVANVSSEQVAWSPSAATGRVVCGDILATGDRFHGDVIVPPGDVVLLRLG
jgi:hypothetical protein